MRNFLRDRRGEMDDVNIRPKVSHCFSAKVCHKFSARRATQSLEWQAPEMAGEADCG